jgi:hypothetical protein
MEAHIKVENEVEIIADVKTEVDVESTDQGTEECFTFTLSKFGFFVLKNFLREINLLPGQNETSENDVIINL